MFLWQNNTNTFFIVPQCPMALGGCDLLVKLQTSINLPFLDPISVLCIQMAPELVASPHSQNLAPDLSPIDPQIWDTEAPSVSRHHSPVQVFLKNPSQVITQTQYTLPTESRQGLKLIISQLLKAGLLQPICSPRNTPKLAVKEGPHSWCLVQDLCKINEAIIPYTPWSLIPTPFSHIFPLTHSTSWYWTSKMLSLLFLYSTPHSPYLPSPGRTQTHINFNY